jgi:phosphopantothenoylcysteine decarboxylase/phosphopantothenate--cysteine ligase
MQSIHKKKIVLGITGGIAAYKSAELLRLLMKAGAEVRVVMSPAAREFIQPLTFQALSGHRVYTDIFDSEAESAMDHIELARWADLMLIAPASADFIAKFNQGFADNILLTLCLASAGPIAIAPAMNQQMYASPSTEENLQSLTARGVHIWGPASGEQACGDIGLGRMLEAEQLTQLVQSYFQPGILHGRRVLITAGPTREAIDPVRYITNRSSGKMGYALATAAAESGAEVTLISGPVSIQVPPGVNIVKVESALDMYDAVMQRVDESDIFIACAAVADYRVREQAPQKIKKANEVMQLSLTRNPDIVASVAALDSPPFTLGFAAETENVEQYAAEKRSRKKLDLIAANRVGGNSGFENDSNEILVLGENYRQPLALAGKLQIARQLIQIVAEKFAGR